MNHDFPLCVDLDGTLLQTDSLHESLFVLIKAKPWLIPVIPFWVFKGKAFFKDRIAEHIKLPVRNLPYNNKVIEFLEKQKSEGRSLILATGAHQSIANRVNNHLKLFDAVYATTSTSNFTGKTKADYLIQNHKNFAYIGNSTTDLPVWEKSQEALIVSNSKSLLNKLSQIQPNITQQFQVEGFTIRAFIKAMRVHQWVKNILIFVPIILGHKYGDIGKVTAGLLGFFSFSLCASSVYILNDLLDLDADRNHPTKKFRPFASGTLGLSTGVILAPILLVVAFLLAYSISWPFVAVLLFYYCLTFSYSFVIKSKILLDTITLATLYTVRILAGGIATQVGVSKWLFLFSVFIFYSLALSKRATELFYLKSSTDGVKERGYYAKDQLQVSMQGVASGFLAVLVFAFYLGSDDVQLIYESPRLLWALNFIVMYWIGRIWILTNRKEMNDDPVAFAIRDKVSILVGLSAVLTVLLARFDFPTLW